MSGFAFTSGEGTALPLAPALTPAFQSVPPLRGWIDSKSSPAPNCPQTRKRSEALPRFRKARPDGIRRDRAKSAFPEALNDIWDNFWFIPMGMAQYWEYRKDAWGNILKLQERLKSQQYRAQPLRRTCIPKQCPSVRQIQALGVFFFKRSSGAPVEARGRMG